MDLLSLCCPQLPVGYTQHMPLYTHDSNGIRTRAGFRVGHPACRVLEGEQHQAELGSNVKYL